MATSSNISNIAPDAVLAVRGLLGCSEDTASEVLEVVKPHIELGLQRALAEAQREITALRARIGDAG